MKIFVFGTGYIGLVADSSIATHHLLNIMHEGMEQFV